MKKALVILLICFCFCKSYAAIDLTVFNYSLSTSNIMAGNSLIVYSSERNLGTTNAGANVISVHLSLNTVLTPGANGDIWIGDISIASCPGNTTTSIYSTTTILLPNTLATGTYYIFFSADGGQVITESNETNNFAYLAINITACSMATPSGLTPGGSSGSPATVSTTTPLLQWASVPNATCYGVYIRNAVNNALIYNNDAATTSNSFTVPGGLLSIGGQYKWNCLAKSTCSNSSCLSGGASTVYFNVGCTLPPAPTGLTATPVSPSRIDISWNSVSGATDYEINGSVGSCPWSSGGTIYLTTNCNTCTTVSATGLNPNTTYRFIILAKNSCGWGTTYNCVSAMTGGGCTYSISPSSVSPSSSSGSGSVSITATAGCSWTAVSNNTSWLTVTSGSSGTGNGTVNYAYTANVLTTPRTGTITVAGYTFTVTQAGSGCSYSISPSSVSPSSSSGSGSVSVTATAGCSWTAVSNNTSWLTVTSGSSGTGNGTVNYAYTANVLTTSRIGTITVAGYTFTVIQAGSISVPTVNSLTGTNVILNHTNIPQNFTFYEDNSPYSNNIPIKVCADGSTATYLKVNVSSTSGISFRVLDENNQPINDVDKYGLLGTPYTLGVNDVEVSYKHPQYMDLNQLSRHLKLEVLYNGTPISGINFPLDIYRAPILFVHGFWGGATTFAEMASELVFLQHFPTKTTFFENNSLNISDYPLFYLVDYYVTNGRSLNTNREIIATNLNKLLLRTRATHYSCGKATVIAHSMGGLLTRLYLSNAWQSSTSYRNDINRIITLNTPHYGSQFANMANHIFLTYGPTSWFIFGLLTISNPYNLNGFDAIFDMKVNSQIINYLNESNHQPNIVSHHELTTSKYFTNASGTKENSIKNWINSCGDPFYPNLTDFIVDIRSQRSMLSLYTWGNTTTNQYHEGSSRNEEVKNEVIELIDKSPYSSFFSNSPYNIGIIPTPSFGCSLFGNNLNSLSDSIKIVSPERNSTYNADDSITFKFTGSSNINRLYAIVGINDSMSFTIDTTFVDSLVIKRKLLSNNYGKLFIGTIGYNSNNFLASDTSSFYLYPSLSLDSFYVDKEYLIINRGQLGYAKFDGLFSDTVFRNLNSYDVTIFNSDTSKIRYMGNGYFYGTEICDTVVQIGVQGKFDSLRIIVTDLLENNIASFRSNLNKVCTGTTIEFTNESLGLVSSVSWQFPGGIPNVSSLLNPNVTYPTPGIYGVTLITTFSNGTDTLSIDSLIEVSVPNSTISSGNWNNPYIWRCGQVPTLNDSVVISSGHIINLNTSTQIRKFTIEENASLTMNDSTVILTVGLDSIKTSPVICNGSVTISNGNLKINGNLKMTNLSHFNMLGGKLTIDGNSGLATTSVTDGQHLFDISTTPTNFNFSGGTLQIVNPPYGVNSQAIKCSYNFSPASTLAFGDGISTIASNNPNGFGGYLLPAEIGKLIFDPATSQNNRVFKNLNSLVIRTRCEVKSGNLIQGALLHILDSLSILDVDGNVYPIVNICNQSWTAKNLEVTRYRNGDTIPQVQNPSAWANLTTGAWCYYQNNTANGPVYGKLYNWYAVNDPRGLAPVGWHIPTNAEWQNLYDTCLGGASIAGGKMKTTGLLLNSTGLWGGNFNNSTNSSGFSGLPAGYCLPNGAFANLSAAGFWWGATSASTSNAWFYEADQEIDELSSSTYSKKLGISVRCVKD